MWFSGFINLNNYIHIRDFFVSPWLFPIRSLKEFRNEREERFFSESAPLTFQHLLCDKALRTCLSSKTYS